MILGGVGVSEHDIFADGGVEEEDILLNDADIVAEEFLRELEDIDAVDEDIARGRLVESGYEGGEGGFTGAGFADEGDGGARGDGDGDVLKDPFIGVGIVFETDLVEGDLSLNLIESGGVFGIDDIGFDVHDLDEAFKGGEALLELFVEIDHAFNGFGDEADVDEEGKDVGERGFEGESGDDGDEGVGLGEEHHAGEESGHGLVNLLFGVFEFVVDVFKFADLVGFVGV